MTETESDVWEKICAIHQKTKKLFLLAEEFSREKSSDLVLDLSTFLQPINELKSTLDHIIRTQSFAFKLHETKDTEYGLKNLRKALGHEYRAFFDTADYFSMIVRDDLVYMLKPYSSEIITRVMADYYLSVKIRSMEISREIAEIRMNKDIGHEGSLIEPTDHYTALIKELLDIHNRSVMCVPEMDREVRTEKSKERKDWLKRGIFHLLAAVFGAFFMWLFTKSSE